MQTLGVDGGNYSMTSTYDTAGRAETLTYPTGFATKNVYNSVGYLSEVRNNSTNALFWKLVAAGPAGITDEDYGNGTGIVRSFDPSTQRVSQIGTLRDSDGALLQNLIYGYDFVGNVIARSETTQFVSETYGYDGVNRLTSVTGPASKTYTYDDIGNITSKSDVGTYTYPSSGKVHAVSSVAGVNYSYDLNGNLQSAGNRSFTWNSFNMPATSQIANASYSWSYDAERQRVKYAAPGETTIYFGAGNSIVLEKTIKPTVTEQKHYVYANGKPVALYTQRSAGNSDTRYLYSDHLRSTTLVLDEVGGLPERLSYDAQGKRRFPSGSDDSANTLSGIATDRGFTEHEHLDDQGIIHMNGRLYDPRVGRFLSPDPFVQNVSNPQNLNRYTYVLNNPLAYIDPSGYMYQGQDGPLYSGGPFNCAIGCLRLEGNEDGAPQLLIDAEGIYGLQTSTATLGDGGRTGTITITGAELPPVWNDFSSPQFCGSCGLLNGAIRDFDSRMGDISYGVVGGRLGAGRSQPGPVTDPATGSTIGRFIVDRRGNTMIEPVGGRTIPFGRGGTSTHTTYPNGSNYHRLDPLGHRGNPSPHGHGHLQGTGPGPHPPQQGPSIDAFGIAVSSSSRGAHWVFK